MRYVRMSATLSTYYVTSAEDTITCGSRTTLVYPGMPSRVAGDESHVLGLAQI